MINENDVRYLKGKNCRGCSNRCSLLNPGCNRSRAYIEEVLRKLNEKENIKSFDNISLF
ncbi:MAG: hypothetical protein IJH12_07355 [Clostridia bacterium]|nr:hypothetical protein [Clostridia bacterium]